ALGQPQQVAIVLEVAGPPAVVEVGDVGRAGDRAKGDMVAAEGQVVRRVAGMERDCRRRLGDQLQDQAAVEADALAAGLNPRHSASPSAWRNSMPISSRIRSEASWIFSSCSPFSTSIGP